MGAILYKDKVYGADGSGGGASAISDLTDVDLDNLSDGQILKWNDITEKWENADESGGGSGYSETTLFTGTYQSYSGEITLNDNLDNYDQIIIWARWTATTTNGATPFLVEREYFVSHYPYDNGSTAQTSNHLVLCPYDNQYTRLKCGSANNKLFLFDAHSIAIERVAGIKYGGGGGSGSSTLAGLSDVDVQTTTPTGGQVLTYDDENDKWINADASGGDEAIILTMAEYNALTPEQQADTTKTYYITDAPGGGGGAIDYSTTEQNTGRKWIDGKPIYQKTVKIESINMGETYALSLGISNIDNIMIDMAGSFLYKDSQSTAIWTLPNVHHNAVNIVGVWFSKDTGYANFRIGSSSRGVVSGAITVRYTKTTDTAS